MKRQYIADSSLLLVTFVWGLTFVLVQNAIQAIEPFSFNAVRFFIGGLILLAWLFVRKRQAINLNRSVLRSGFILGCWLFIGYITQTFGLLYTTSSKAGFITGLSVVLVPMLSVMMLKEKPKWLSVVGVLLATIGLFFLTLGEQLAMNKGDILVLFCAVAFAMHIIFTDRYTHKHSALLLTIIQLMTVAGLSFVSAILFEDISLLVRADVLFHPDVLLAILVTALFATAFAFLAQTAFQKHTTPTRVALIFTMEPVFAALAGVILAHEVLGDKALLGCILIFIGMILSELAGVIQTKIAKRKLNKASL